MAALRAAGACVLSVAVVTASVVFGHAVASLGRLVFRRLAFFALYFTCLFVLNLRLIFCDTFSLFFFLPPPPLSISSNLKFWL